MSPVLEPEPEKGVPDTAPTTFRLPKVLVKEIDNAAKALGLSRNKAVNQLLRYALDAHWKDAGKKPRK